jgi:hypothetical protein
VPVKRGRQAVLGVATPVAMAAGISVETVAGVEIDTRPGAVPALSRPQGKIFVTFTRLRCIRVCYERFYNLLVNKFMRLKLQGWALSLTS